MKLLSGEGEEKTGRVVLEDDSTLVEVRVWRLLSPTCQL